MATRLRIGTMQRMRLLVAATLILSLPSAGCCSLARLFCGPDKTPWISEDFSTPKKTVTTFLEALRRDEPEVLYLAMSAGLREQLGIDAMTTQLAWPKIREQYPGLHLAGYAEVPEPERLAPDRARVLVDVEGHPLELTLLRETFWEVRYERRGEQPGTYGPPGMEGGTRGSLRGLADVELLEDALDDRSRVRIAPMTFEHFGLDEVPSDDLTFAGVFRRWKVSGMRMQEP